MGRKLSKKELNEALDDHLVSSGVSFLPKSDEDDAYRVLADAFKEDPMVAWVAGLEEDDPERETKTLDLGKNMMAWVNHRLVNRSRGVALGVRGAPGSGWVGCMTLAPSSRVGGGPVDLLHVLYVIFRYGAPPMHTKKADYGPHAAKRLDELKVLGKRRKELMKGTERWVYLQTIGVLSAHHGKGHGKKMLQLLMKAAEDLKASLYLETESAENESLYQHFGFRTLEKLDLHVKGDDTPTANLTMYLMRKDPKE